MKKQKRKNVFRLSTKIDTKHERGKNLTRMYELLHNKTSLKEGRKKDRKRGRTLLSLKYFIV